jgi:hypothetical protein
VQRTLDEPRLDVAAALRYPFAADRWPWVAAALVAGAVIEIVASLPVPFVGLLALILRVIVWMTLYRVASEVLLAAADGRDAPGAGAYTTSDGLAARHIGLWLIGTIAVAAATVQFGVFGALLGALVLAAVLPAATIVLTLSTSLIEALVPTQWVRLVRRLGRDDYVLLFGTLLGAAVGYLLLSLALAAAGVGDLVRHSLVLGFWAASVLAWFRLAGRAVWLHREELGLDDADTEPEPEPERFTRDPAQLWAQIRREGGTRAMHAELARQLSRSGDRETRLAHGRMHVEALLLAFEAPDEAVDRAAALLEDDPALTLSDAATTYRLVDASATQGLRDVTLRLAENLVAKFPNSSRAARAKLRACELLADDASARRRTAEAWFRELMVTELNDELRGRLQALADAYAGPEGRTPGAPLG